MNEPVWLDRELIVAIQSVLISRFGGLDGIRDETLLDPALQRPLQHFHYEKPDHFFFWLLYMPTHL